MVKKAVADDYIRDLKLPMSSLDSLEGTYLSTGPACPISGEKLDERAVRIVAAIVVGMLLAYVWLRQITGTAAFFAWIPVFLTIDFALRAGLSRKWSPLARIARWTVGHLDVNKRKTVDAAPKIFAARLGLVFSVTLFAMQICLSAGHVAEWLVLGMFAFAAFLEAAFAVCLGCHIYAIFGLGKRAVNYLGDGI